MAASAAAVVGSKVTETVQVAAAARLEVQVFEEIANEDALVPVSAMELMVTAPVPALVRVTVLAALVVPVVTEPKASVVGEAVRMVVGAAPVPVSATVCGEPVALSVTERVAARAPAVAGSKVMETVQVAAAAMLEVQVFDEMAKEDALVPVPVMAMEEMVTAPVPVLVTVTF